jgi:hypothetical protein
MSLNVLLPLACEYIPVYGPVAADGASSGHKTRNLCKLREQQSRQIR